MTNLKKVLLTSAALAMFSGAAFAGGRGNESFTNQAGEQNTLTIYQDQSTQSKVGAADNAAQQTGKYNTLVIDQDGRAHEVGAKGGDFQQNGWANLANIKQTGTGNEVQTVNQQSIGGVSNWTNYLKVEQSNNNNTVENVYQGNGIGAEANAIEIKQSGTSNTIKDVAQLGKGNGLKLTQGGGGGNDINYTYQDNRYGGSANEMTISQSGNRNYVEAAAQTNTGGALNSATLNFTGNDNGKGDFSIKGIYRSFGNGAKVNQVGTGNTLTATFIGDSNTFGFYQQGTDHLINASITGNDNETAISQYDSTQIANVTVKGNNNDVGIVQFGFNNTANVGVGTLSGASFNNTAAITQSGSYNVSNVNQ